MHSIQRVAVLGASGNFGKPITAALREANFDVTIITRVESTTQHLRDIPVRRTEYTFNGLIGAMMGQDAVVCVVGPAGIGLQTTFIDAAEAAGVKRFIIDDFGWGPHPRVLPEFEAIHAHRVAGWEHARKRAEANPNFTWTGVTSGNPIDWALKKFPLMGFDVADQSAIIYDDGTEFFTGTTLSGIGQAVVGIMQHPGETSNRFVKILSIKACQNDLLDAFETVTSSKWKVQRSTANELMERGRAKFDSNTSGWILDLVVAQLFDKNEARCVVAPARAESDSVILGVREESAISIAEKVLAR